eukprot:8586953-Lingulodinium_polyedra.AAC.1
MPDGPLAPTEVCRVDTRSRRVTKFFYMANTPVSTIDWKSGKLKQVCRSSLSAECQAMAEALDTL